MNTEDFLIIFSRSWFLYVQCSDGVYYNTNVTYHQEHQGGIYTLTVLNGTSSSV